MCAPHARTTTHVSGIVYRSASGPKQRAMALKDERTEWSCSTISFGGVRCGGCAALFGVDQRSAANASRPLTRQYARSPRPAQRNIIVMRSRRVELFSRITPRLGRRVRTGCPYQIPKKACVSSVPPLRYNVHLGAGTCRTTLAALSPYRVAAAGRRAAADRGHAASGLAAAAAGAFSSNTSPYRARWQSSSCVSLGWQLSPGGRTAAVSRSWFSWPSGSV